MPCYIPIALCGALFELSSCVVWPAQNRVAAVSPGLSFRGEQPPCWSTLRGVLWPPSDRPTFVVGGRRIVAEIGGVVSEEAETDRHGRFELDIKKRGPHKVSFTTSVSTSTWASASAEISIGRCSTQRIDLVAHLDSAILVPPPPPPPPSASR